MKKLLLVLSLFVAMATSLTSCIVAPSPAYNYGPPVGYHPWFLYRPYAYGHHGHAGYHDGHWRGHYHGNRGIRGHR